MRCIRRTCCSASTRTAWRWRRWADSRGDLLRAGLGAAVFHGPDCERVREAFDDEADGAVDLSCHEHDRFADTLFAWAMFLPGEPFPAPEVRTAVLVAQPARARDIHRWLPAFCAASLTAVGANLYSCQVKLGSDPRNAVSGVRPQNVSHTEGARIARQGRGP